MADGPLGVSARESMRFAVVVGRGWAAVVGQADQAPSGGSLSSSPLGAAQRGRAAS